MKVPRSVWCLTAAGSPTIVTPEQRRWLQEESREEDYDTDLEEDRQLQPVLPHAALRCPALPRAAPRTRTRTDAYATCT